MGDAKNSEALEAFIRRWQGREGGQERANYALFLNELIALLGLPSPDPADATHEHNDYVFERAVLKHRDEGGSHGRIDLYKRNSFVLEAKQSRLKGVKKIAGQDDLFTTEVPEGSRGRRGADRAWDVLMLNAKRQAEEYARALPTSHGWPPFILVCDVGHCIEVYADFSGQGKNYTQFPDRQKFRIYLEDLRIQEVRDRLRGIWLDPASLDPTQASAKVTRDIAKRLAQVSLALERKNYPAQDVAMFLMRRLFTMFAEDVGLLPEKSFKEILEECEKNPQIFTHDVSQLWEAMNSGGWAHALRQEVKKFNGEFFRSCGALPLGREEIGELRQAASYSWKEVDPSIFGTLLEQALDKEERKRLGAHYTPRAYVERLVIATVIEPLREDWRNVQAAAETKRGSGELKGAAAEVKAFHDKLCETRVLDPACGTGNFLYVSLELMKRLEGEVLEALLDLGGQEALRGLGSHSVDPHQFLGLEINLRAAAIAELVLWIGYLQWHFRTKGGPPEEPILRAFRNIQVKNAVLTWDGEPVPKIVGGKETYPNARRPEWPAAEFIAGNPPFIGNKRMREQLSSEYVDALRVTNSPVPESVDFVMYWWDRAAEILERSNSTLRRFGFVTTNSIGQSFNRRVLSEHIERRKAISLIMAISDHPWIKVDSASAAVRIAMTVAERGLNVGSLFVSRHESGLDTDEPKVELEESHGMICTDLTIGPAVANASNLLANIDLAHQGVTPLGEGFRLDRRELDLLGIDPNNLPGVVKQYLIGRDLAQRPQERFIIDFWGLTDREAREAYPKLFQIILDRVKPERHLKNRTTYREKYWIYAEPRSKMRAALDGLNKYIVTCRTAKHRLFSFVGREFIADAKIVVIASDSESILSILSSRLHQVWAERTGAWLGVGNDSNYNHSECFSKFPFPNIDGDLLETLGHLGKELDVTRKRVQKEHSDITMTNLYNVLEKIKLGAVLSREEEDLKNKGLVLIIKQLHDEIDTLTFAAYGWPSDLSDNDLLTRLVALNKERADEEKRGLVRWLRPDYQIPRFAKDVDKQAAKEEGAQVAAELIAAVEQKPSFPSGAVEQTAAVFATLSEAEGPIDAKGLAAQFRRTKSTEKKVGEVLASLARLGYVASADGKTFMLRRVA
jgi:hypothetical protein